MQILVFGMLLGLYGCALAPERSPAETHVCTQSPDGLAECRLIEPSA